MQDLASQTLLNSVAEQYPEEFRRLAELTRVLHETSRLMFYQNIRKD
ncbi:MULTISPECIES: hypothetical protein [Pseudomonas]